MVRTSIVLFSLMFSIPLFSGEKPIESIIPVTMANLKGHETLYTQGWMLIPSTQKSFSYCKEKGVDTARRAWIRLAQNIQRDSKKWAQLQNENPDIAKALFKWGMGQGKAFSKGISEGTDNVVQLEVDLAKWSLGSIHFKPETHDDVQEIKNISGNFFSNLKDDFSNMKELVSFLRTKKSEEIEGSWSRAFQRAGDEFEKEYKKSGDEKNSLMALPHVLWGHMKALYYGLLSPMGQSTVKAGKWVGKGILFPVGGAILVSGRTVFSTGGAFYYTGKMGVRVLANTIESGLLATVSLASIIATVPTYVGGKGLSAINRVAMSSAAGAGAAGTWALATTAESALYAGNVVYDVGKASGETILSTGKVAVVLGYNALTALPTHLVLGALDSTFFLVWDGPKLAIAAVKGELQHLPVGTVVDLKKLENSNVKVDIIPTDDETLKTILEKLPDDMRVKP